MKKLFIGLDVSKDVFDFCALNDLGEQESSKKVFQNSKQGIDQFCKSLKKWNDSDILICLEHTGHYGYLLSYELAKRNLQYALIHLLTLSSLYPPYISSAPSPESTTFTFSLANFDKK